MVEERRHTPGKIEELVVDSQRRVFLHERGEITFSENVPKGIIHVSSRPLNTNFYYRPVEVESEARREYFETSVDKFLKTNELFVTDEEYLLTPDGSFVLKGNVYMDFYSRSLASQNVPLKDSKNSS